MNYSHRKKSVTEEWSVDLSDGSQTITSSVANIVFVDGVFSKVDFYGKNPYSREDWRMLAYINDVITQIEGSNIDQCAEGRRRKKK